MASRILSGDCLDIMAGLPDESVDAVVTDPPYGLGFMGKAWDALPPGEEWARECLRVLKPGGHLLAFGGTRTWHRLAVAVEDAGFEIRDSIAWLYGSGFPKSLNVSKAIDNLSEPSQELLTDAAQQWQGWGTALKPAFEPVVVARKPLAGTVAANVQEWGTGAINIDACRVESDGSHMVKGTVTKRTTVSGDERTGKALGMYGAGASFTPTNHEGGRWPANVVLDESQAAALDEQSGTLKSGLFKPEHADNGKDSGTYGAMGGRERTTATYGDSGGASRFFYVAKAPKKERPVVDGVAHPTVKPLTLMRWLVRLVTPPGGTILEPFAGSGTTVEAALLEGFDVIGIERDESYLPLIQARIDRVTQDAADKLTEPEQPDLFAADEGAA